jgi:hypothetical protein
MWLVDDYSRWRYGYIANVDFKGMKLAISL